MEIDKSNFKTAGQLLEHLLQNKGWTNRVLAIVLGIDETGISKIISNSKSVTPEIAILLEEVFDVSAQTFLSLQRDYDLAKARIESRPDDKRATRANLFSGLPVPEMIRRGWLNVNDIRDVSNVEKALSKFFEVDSVEQIEILPHAAKKTMVYESTTAVQLAWLYRVKKIASEMIVGKYSNFSVRRAIELLKPLTSAAEETRKVPRILAECGIRFLLVEALPSSKIDGVCFWLNEDSPVIAMSTRFDRIDNFWFVLRHELEHVLQEHGKSVITIDSDMESSNAIINEEEDIANKAAAEFCVPQKTMDSFIARKSPVFADRDILGVAATLRVHPGLIAGQIRYKTGMYDRFNLNKHLVKIRSIVAPSAVVDGWGDIAQIEI